MYDVTDGRPTISVPYLTDPSKADAETVNHALSALQEKIRLAKRGIPTSRENLIRELRKIKGMMATFRR